MRPLAKLLTGHVLERAGFYLVLDMIGLYANEKLGWSVSSSALLGGLLGGAAYVGPVIGGPMSDKLGRGKTLLAGACALLISYACLAAGAPLILVALMMAAGNGLYKPAATVTCGAIADVLNRQAALYKLYIATNVGALAAPLVGEAARHWLGWPGAFGSAAVMLVATSLIASSRSVQAAASTPAQELEADAKSVDRRLGASERTLYALYAACAIFWCAFNQFNGSLTFYARDWVDRSLLWLVVPPAVFAALNSAFIIMLGERVPNFFKRLGLSFKQQLTAGMLITAAGFAIVFASTKLAQPGHASMLVLVGLYFCMTIAELLISPAMMTLIAHAAPARRAGAHMGLWFGSNAVGHFASGGVGALKASIGYDGIFAVLIAATLFGALVVRRAGRGISES